MFPVRAHFNPSFSIVVGWAALTSLFPGINKSINNLEVSCVRLLFMLFTLLLVLGGPPSHPPSRTQEFPLVEKFYQ